MPASFREILNSRLFKFTVGEKVDGSPTEIFVHEEAIAQLSKSLCNLMKGGWSESEAGVATWDTVSKETFERFVQFAYTGDYSVPKAEKLTNTLEKEKAANGLSWQGWRNPRTCPIDEEVPAEPEPVPEPEVILELEAPELAQEPPPEEAPEPEAAEPEEPVPEASEPEAPEPEVADFKSLSFPLLAPRNNHSSACKAAKFFHKNHSYSNVFLGHASLYLVADFQFVESLKALALFKLHKTLCVFRLNDENAEDIVDLVRYVYSERFDDGTGGLRSLVCQYLATNAVVLSRDDGFMELLAEGGQLVKDFFKMQVQMRS